LKKSKNVSRIVNDLKTEQIVDWRKHSNAESMQACNLYVELKWCKKYKNRLEQFEEFQLALNRMKPKTFEVIRAIINTVPYLKLFMIIHSVFDINDFKNGEPLTQFLVGELFPTDDEIQRAHEPDYVPQELLDRLAVFAPRPLRFEKYCDSVYLTYNMWGNTFEGQYPINIIDRNWEAFGREEEERKEIPDIISGYDVISV